MPAHTHTAVPHDTDTPCATPAAHHQRGAVAVLVIMLLPILLMVSAFAVDIANLMLVKNELQNAADSAAQAGAQCLYPRTECFNTLSAAPDWATSQTRASLAVAHNAAQGRALSTGVVASGYWNITGTPHTLQLLPHTPGANEAPAIQVTISKQSGKNGGSVVLYLAGLLGLATADVSATAVSVVTSPGVVGPGGLFPFAITKCMYDQYWDSTTATPKLATTTTLLGVPQVIGQPWVFHLGAAVYTPCDGGEWTSFALDDNNVPTIKDLIANGNPTQLAKGDQTWIEPGSKTALYGTVAACSAAGDKSCEYVTMPVTTSANSKGEQTILDFGCLHILNAAGGSGKYIAVQMDTTCPSPQGSGTGTNYGVHDNPRLAL